MLISAYKGSEANRALQITAESLGKLKAEILILEQKADEITGKIMPVKYVGGAFGRWYPDIGSHFKQSQFYANNAPTAIAGRARTYLKSLYIPAIKTHKTNIPAIANNKALENKIRLIMSNIGITPQYTTYEYKTNRSSKKTKLTRNAGYVSDINRLIKTDDGFGKIKAEFVEKWNSINAYLKEEQDKKKAIEKEKERQLAAENAEKQRAVLIVKYELLYESDWSEILETILAKDKYLALAHALMLNRGDWNDGYSYAENGLSNFTVEADKDKKINKDIQNCIDNWDGDGRVFRDTKYNYDRIFGMVQEDLMKDYNLAYGNCPN